MKKSRNPFATLARRERPQVIPDKREKIRDRDVTRYLGLSRRGVI